MTTTISSNPLTSSSTTQHTYGLSGSGIDVDSQVQSLMKAATVPYTKLWQQEQQAEWKKAEYNTFYNSINTYNTNVFNYTLQGTLLPQIATSSNTSIATATANADAGDINHSLTVSQLATGVSETSTAAITPTGNSKTTLQSQFGLTSSNTFNISITNNGTTKSITVDPTQSIYTLVSQINNAGVNVKANYDATLDRFFLYTANTGSTAKIDFSGSDTAGMNFLNNNLKLGGASIGTIGTSGVASSAAVSMASGKDQTSLLQDAFTGLVGSSPFKLSLTNGSTTNTVTIDPSSQSLNDVITAINGAGVNASASYDAVSGKFTLQASSGTLSLAGSDQAALNFFTGNLNLPASGQDAQITLDGTSLTEPSNNFTISGVTYNLQSTGSTNVSVAADVDKIVSNVQSFVDSYNTMLSSLNTEVSQPVYSDYMPLTDDQKSAMKDSDITAWNAKAKSGLLHNDSILQTAINSMRDNVASPIAGLTGKYTSAASIGITTGDYTEGGKLYLDKDKLRAALQADPTIVNKIFGSAGSSTNVSSQGIAVRLHNTLNTAVSQIKMVAGTTADTKTDSNSNLAKRITDYNTRLTALSTKLQDLQTRYYKQFDAMETALQQMNSQSSWFTSMTSSSSK